MSFENLRTTHPVLLQFLKEHNYSDSTIGAISREISTILENADARGWDTYRDIYHVYESEGLKKCTLQDKRYYLRTIQRFDIDGEFPNRGQRSYLFECESYENLPSEFKELVEFYREHEPKRGTKATTMYLRIVTTISFLRCMQKRGCSRFDEIMEKDVVSFFLSDDGKLIRGCTCKESITAVLKAGLNWKEETCRRILPFLPTLRQNRKIIQYLTEEEADSIRLALRDSENLLSFRDRAIGTLLLYTGMRKCDINGLQLENIDWKHDSLHIVQQKTDVPMELPLTAAIGNALFDYLNSERPDSCNGHVFLCKVPPYRPLAAGSIDKVVKHVYKAAGIRQNPKDRKGTHIFRHHAASHMLERGVAKPVISRVLGHTAPDSLEPYLMADFQHLKECALSVESFPIPEEVLPL